METKLADFKREGRSPIIGVIGATFPTMPYKKHMGMKVGYVLRSYVEREEGSIFTGGVEGVGVDVYTGVTRFCIDEGIRRGELLEDGFFVLIPENIEVGSKETYRTMKYNPPDSYEALAQLSRRRELDIVRAGANMNERREKVAEVADVIITVNGGMGTLDEAVNKIRGKKGTPVKLLILRNNEKRS